MTFITLNNARIKVGAIINYTANTIPNGLNNLFVIDVQQAISGVTAVTQIQYTTQAARDADLKLLDSAVAIFIEPATSIFLTGNLTLHNNPMPFYPNVYVGQQAQVAGGNSPV